MTREQILDLAVRQKTTPLMRRVAAQMDATWGLSRENVDCLIPGIRSEFARITEIADRAEFWRAQVRAWQALA